MEKIRSFLESLEQIMNDFGASLGLLIAGFFGALLSLEDKQGLNSWERMSTLIVGMAIANYVTPIFIDYSADNIHMAGFAGFTLGYGGLKGFKVLILALKKRWGGKHE